MLQKVQEQYHKITTFLIRHHITISTMESCTSGLIASLLTDTEGSSEVFRGSLVTYSNEAKELFGVPEEVIETYGVYSADTAEEMAKTCRRSFQTDIGIGITGTFGNVDPNNQDSIPGIVFIAVTIFDSMFSIRLELKEQSTRFAYKVETADKLAVELLNILQAYEDYDS